MKLLASDGAVLDYGTCLITVNFHAEMMNICI